MLSGLMMERPLSIASILDFAAEVHGGVTVASSGPEGLHRQSYRQTRSRALRMAAALRGLGVVPGDRVATLAWNSHRHLELYYAISGSGAVCHTINPRLPVDRIGWIARHAQDRVLFFDADLTPLVVALAPDLPAGIRLVCLCAPDDVPAESPPGTLAYEALIAAHDDSLTWPEIPETAASGLCYSSGTTGDPKGALYSHRSTVLHAMATVLAAPTSFGTDHRILPAVPLFHVNAWSLPFGAPLTGSGLVMPGARLDGDSLFHLMETEGVTAAWGVPTVWAGLIDTMRREGRKPAALRVLLIGGSAVGEAQIRTLESEFGIDVLHGWGMTELSPVGTVTRARRGQAPGSDIAGKLPQGIRLFGTELRIASESGTALPHDGTTVGELEARGNSTIRAYFGDEAATARAFEVDGWFRTGDVARITPDGVMTVVDRSKDLIKSGGEWISSIDLENIAMTCPGVRQAAAIAVPDDRWGERPLLVVIPDPLAPATAAQITAHLGKRLAKWQVPQHILFRDSLPLTATGKVSKRDLRRMLALETPRGEAQQDGSTQT